RLLENEQALDRLESLRGWTPDALAALAIGLDGDRVLFPYRDARGRLVGVGLYAPNPERRNGTKLLALRGSTRTLFPIPEQVKGDLVFLVEGEPDAVRAWSLGLPAIAVPGVAGWRAEWAARFAGRSVVVCFDCDGPGRAAGTRVLGDLE